MNKRIRHNPLEQREELTEEELTPEELYNRTTGINNRLGKEPIKQLEPVNSRVAWTISFLIVGMGSLALILIVILLKLVGL